MGCLPEGIPQRLESGWVDACSFGLDRLVLVLVCRLVTGWFSCWSVWSVSASFVLACLLPVGSLVVRTSGLVLNGVDGVFVEICSLCLLRLLALLRTRLWRGLPICMRPFAVCSFSLHAAIHFTLGLHCFPSNGPSTVGPSLMNPPRL
jgi:hypothetical protein